nr:glycosyltransferase [Eubacterium sp.]
MKKIGFVNFDMSTRGGAQQVLHNIANALCEEYEIHVISMIHEKGECAYQLREGIHYHAVLEGKQRIRQVIQCGGKPFREYCKENSLELLFYVGAYAGLCGGLLGRTLKMPKVFCDHGALLNQWKEAPARIMRTVGSRFSERTVVLTKQSEKAYYDKFGYKEGRIQTIYNWMDDTILANAGEYDTNSRCILTAGRFSKEKGMDLLVDVAGKLREKTEDFTWEVYGEGDMFPEISERIQQDGLTEHVKLKGLTNEMEKCYQGHCMYVLTSYREGLPLVLLEAKANHLPLISFDIVSGPGEIVTDGQDGVLIPPYDTEKMAEAIYQLLENGEKRKQMSDNSVLRMELFEKEKILNQWRALIEEM